MSKQAFDRKLEALEALRSNPEPDAALAAVGKALRDRNNYVVSKAAAIAADLKMAGLVPDLVAALDRFLADPVKTDPQCWAKTAIAKALKDLGHRDAGVFLRGLRHVQMEPVWGGRADSAAALRGTCSLALVDCRLDDFEILSHLIDGLADPEKPVRIDAAIAIGQLGRPEGALLLRLKLLLGDGEPEVMGQCFSSLLGLEPRDSVPFIGRFLSAPDTNVRLEAAGVLAQSHEPEAIGLLRQAWSERLPAELRTAFIACLGASPLREAAEFLLAILAGESAELATSAVAALAASRFRSEMRARAWALVERRDEPGLTRAFAREFAEEPGSTL